MSILQMWSVKDIKEHEMRRREIPGICNSCFIQISFRDFGVFVEEAEKVSYFILQTKINLLIFYYYFYVIFFYL